MATTLYPTATLHINQHPYPAMVPPYIQTIHPAVLRGTFFAPIYQAFDDQMPQRSTITIAKMVELCVSTTTFTIIDDHDILEILHQIDAYVEEVYPMRSDNRIMPYLEKILKLRSRIYTLFLRVLNRHPQWKQAYSGDMGIFSVIQELYRPLGIETNMPKTMVEELVLCPTVRRHPNDFNPLINTTANAKVTPDNMGPLYRV